MKRHRALVALSHDHHHALVAARRLRRAAEAGADAAAAAASFTSFFGAETAPHFREEEEWLFPLVADVEDARPLLIQALLDHQRLRALVRRLEAEVDVQTMIDTADLLETHVRREERELFPLIERAAAAELERGNAAKATGGPVWGEASDDLNATLLAWNPGGGPAEHVNDERDVLVFVVEGSATLAIDGEQRELRTGEAVIVGKGRRRSITAGRGGVRYLSVHLRRPPLQIESA